MKLYVYSKVRFGRIPKRHQPVGWHLQVLVISKVSFQAKGQQQKSIANDTLYF